VNDEAFGGAGLVGVRAVWKIGIRGPGALPGLSAAALRHEVFEPLLAADGHKVGGGGEEVGCGAVLVLIFYDESLTAAV
jgi:hypothetical protein